MKHLYHNRILSFFLAVVMFLTTAPFPVLSVESGQGSVTENSASASGELIYDYDTLKIMLDGKESYSLGLYEHEKIEIQVEGLTEDADYQWQVQHPENDDVWVNIYDGTDKTISVSMALVGNVLRADGTAKLRCRAYTEDYAYLTSPMTVRLLTGQAAPEAAAFSARSGVMAVAEGEETPEFVTVTIEYIRYDFARDENGNLIKDEKGDFVLDESGSQAFTPFIATLVYDTSLQNHTVTFPTMVGYEAYLGDATVPSTAYTIDVIGVKENITYTVKYKPALVDYSVRYYFQNIYDDLYVENTDEKVSGKGYTGSTPPDSVVKKEFAGFTSLYYQPDTIAADGSTVFAVYYERTYYLMEFDCAGGYGTDTVYVRQGTYISVPTPIKSGYVFQGWDLVKTEQEATAENPLPTLADGQQDTLPETMPPYNSGYKALWATAETTYTVVYWRENADDDGYSYWGSKQVDAVSNDHVSATDHTDTTGLSEAAHFTYNSVKTQLEESKRTDLASDGKVIVEGDGSTVVNVYFSRKSYTLKFYYATSTGTEDDVENNENYYVIGGSTYRFGSTATISETDNEIALLRHYMSDYAEQRGEVDEVPTLNLKGSSKNYQMGSDDDTVNGDAYKYYYISFAAKYGSDISELWPCDVFNSVTRLNKNNVNGWSGTEAFVSAWNGEHHVSYSQKKVNQNQTIKGKYQQLDDLLLWDSSFGQPEDGTVTYLCFWENGANIGWSVPELYRYKIWLEGNAPNGEIEAVKDGVTYYLSDTYDTCDNSSVSEQTQPSIIGFEFNQLIQKDEQNYKYAIVEGEDSKYYEYIVLSDFDTSLYKEGYEVNFYYTRNIRNLKFYNYNDYFADGTGVNLAFGTSLSKYGEYVNPEDMQNLYYPDGIEPGAYEFGGWYTSAGCYDGTEMDWNTAMPDNNLTVYAKWTPVIHDVYFYLLYSDIDDDDINDYWIPEDENGNQIPTEYPIKVEHGQLLGTTHNNYRPKREEGYTFVGWFYMDEDGKKRFAPDSMEIKQELHLFAEWQSGIDTQYEVNYVLKEDTELSSGETFPAGTVIADPTKGHSTAGQTKTFTAKGTGELYDDFQTNLFPTTSSHSILMDEDSGNNTFQFEYVKDDLVYYLVRYVDYVTKQELANYVIKSTENAIVTEKFLPIPNYIPQSYYIRKALVADGNTDGSLESINAENVITFYYTQDTEHGLYSVEYYLQYETLVNPYDPHDPVNFYQYESIVGSADIGTTYTATVRQYDGYTHLPALNTVITYDANGNETVKTDAGDPPSGTVAYTGLTIKIYYQRNEYPYIIEYREYGAAADAAPLRTITDANSKAKFDAVISHTAPATLTIGDKEYVYYIENATEEQRTKSMTIRHFENGEENPNKLIFYYTQKQIQIMYHAVCTIPGITGGKVSLNTEYISGDTAIGSTALKYDGFQFVGWFEDAECIQAVNPDWVYPDRTGNFVLKPVPSELKAEDIVNDVIHYYALFAPVETELTIQKQISNVGTITDNFLFRIQGKEGTVTAGVDLIVSICGNGSVTIKDIYCGEYTITELTNWSWEYNLTGITVMESGEYSINGSAVTVVILEQDPDAARENVITFINQSQATDWLGSENSKDNTFTGVSP